MIFFIIAVGPKKITFYLSEAIKRKIYFAETSLVTKDSMNYKSGNDHLTKKIKEIFALGDQRSTRYSMNVLT